MRVKGIKEGKKEAPELLMEYFDALYQAFGAQRWWPARTRTEVIVGAILTQNTAWTNVEKAISNLKKAGVLSITALIELPTTELASLIRPSGYFNVKAARLKNFFLFLSEYYGASLNRLFAGSHSGDLRSRILSVKGIGPETADSILLYAGGRGEFVVDAYTKRVFFRHGLVEEKAGYEEVKQLFMDNLPADTPLFNEYHALIVRLGKEYCRPRDPRCEACPLKDFLTK